ncbi:hypothetical protein F5X68DRAFT_261454 [Plectosphaerella plurivora]|uniref:Uncharacterized protein n=1 Tax=Plectosphaerella plurivora TaxID=936078 RepID=A0A9P9AAY8_9PEZI|nr:hypothetical protein F5X68DRAFT_261454 [Plectosphaerella plurivora]
MAGPSGPPVNPPLRKKMVYSVDTPFSAVQWPEISSDDQDAILELLCSFLAPIGHHRRNVPASKGKRAKKRKRAAEKEDQAMTDAPPLDEAPERSSFVDVGFSTITRRLQELSGRNASAAGEEPNGQPYAFVFVARSGQSAAFNGHFPQMVAFASKASPDEPPIRLVGYSKACGERLSNSLGLPRVSSIGVRQNAPGAEALINFVRERVSPIPLAWMEEGTSAEFRPCQVLAEEKMVPVTVKSVPAKTLPSR